MDDSLKRIVRISLRKLREGRPGKTFYALHGIMSLIYASALLYAYLNKMEPVPAIIASFLELIAANALTAYTYRKGIPSKETLYNVLIFSIQTLATVFLFYSSSLYGEGALSGLLYLSFIPLAALFSWLSLKIVGQIYKR